MKHLLNLWLLLAALLITPCSAGPLPPVQTVFVILMENHNWSSLKGSVDAPFLNTVLLPRASYCSQYYNPPGLHPSEPNYLWLEAGTNFGILNDNDPASNHQRSTNHLVTLLKNAGITWKTYQEDINGLYVPLSATNKYVARHNPFVFFDDVTGTNNPYYPYALAHIRPYPELAGDLTNHTVARYNFITPNLCNDTHDSCAPLYNPIRQGDNWLAAEVPKILNSAAYQDGGALFITWDEGISGDGPIGMIVLSPLARGAGYSNNIHYTHSSFLRTLQDIFGVKPYLGAAATANDLSDLFIPFRFGKIHWTPEGTAQLTATGLVPNRTNILQVSADLVGWTPVSTNLATTNTIFLTDDSATNATQRFYRLVLPP